MPIKDAKIYNDGSHFIAIPPENFTSGKHKKQPPKATTQDTKKQAFETAYKESMSLPKRERKKYIAEKLQSEFETAEQAKAYTEQNIERKKTNAAKRYTRLWRKVRLQQWNYFITFTFDGNKHTEESFKKTLRLPVSRTIFPTTAISPIKWHILNAIIPTSLCKSVIRQTTESILEILYDKT